jgi:signal transduction histidine kinase
MPDQSGPRAAASSEFFRELDTQLLVHELKGPLSLIEAAARTLLAQAPRHGSLTERQEKTLERILRGAVRGRQVVHQLLEIGRAEASQFTYESFEPAEMVLEVLLESVESTNGELAGRLADESTAEQKLAVLTQSGIHLRVTQGLESLRIFQDPLKFRLIVGNLLQNALHFRKQWMEIVLQKESDNLIITVRDDGPGIAPEHHLVVFEAYKQVYADDGLERKGHGLGLAGARILARRLGGDIALDSVPGRGATFRFSIPCGQVDAPANETRAGGEAEHVGA